MTTIFINLKNSKASDPYRLVPNLTDKINLQRGDESIALLNLSIYYILKGMETIILKHRKQHGIKHLKQLMDPILSLIFRSNSYVRQQNLKQNYIQS